MTIVKVDAEKIKEARALSGLSQEEMAQRLGLSKSAVFNWESGRGSPYPKTLKKISAKPVDSISDIGYIQLVGRTTKQRNEDTKMKKTICAADLTASNYDEARAILGQMETVVDWTFNQGLFTVEYSTDDQETIEKDWQEALASLPE